jgi:hypothetical protein
MRITTLLSVWLVGLGTVASAFSSYAVHLEPTTMATSCDSRSVSSLRDFAYRFRAYTYPSGQLSFHDGKNTDTDVLRGVEWVSSVEHQEPIELDGQPALLAVVFSNHVGGSGSATHLLVIRCRNERLEVVFEAGRRRNPSLLGDRIFVH